MTLPVAGPSRPVRAVITVVSGWIVGRAVMLWPAAAIVDGEAPVATALLPDIAQPLVPADILNRPAPGRTHNGQRNAPKFAKPIARGHAIEIVPNEPVLPQDAVMPGTGSAPLAPRTTVPRRGPEALPPPNGGTSRFSGSAWSLARSAGGGPGLANGGQLGGSQVGARVFYAPGPKTMALTGRVSAPLGTRLGREASVGVALRGKTVGVIVEHRFALDRGGRDAPSVTVYGGVSEISLGGGIRLDGYAQAGVVGVTRPAGFIDGAIRLERTVAEDRNSRLSAGIALTGGAQPGVSRLDIGPQLVARVPVGSTAVRVSAEWRQRIAGHAAPGSGPAVTVGFDF